MDATCGKKLAQIDFGIVENILSSKKGKRKMKKNVWTKVITICLAAVLVMGSVAQPAEAAAGYKFKYKGVTITMHSPAKKFIKKAGKVQKKKVKKSCAYKGKDRTYQYRDFILYTYSKSAKGAEYVMGVTFRTNKVATREGVKIGSPESLIKKKYGKAKAKFGIYTYKKGKCKLQFEIANKKVRNIRYVTK